MPAYRPSNGACETCGLTPASTRTNHAWKGHRRRKMLHLVRHTAWTRGFAVGALFGIGWTAFLFVVVAMS